jgi:small-conductance mechanosensitive channel
VLAVYKEQRFSAASIRDYGQLHQSLRIGIDTVYWIMMSFVLQAVFGFVLTDYLLPFITLILSLSFSLAPLASNYLLAFAFVFFMAPFDIGHRVRIVFTSGADVVDGHVKSITLLHTIVTTLREETVSVCCMLYVVCALSSLAVEPYSVCLTTCDFRLTTYMLCAL